MMAIKRLLPDPPAAAFLPGQALHGWTPANVDTDGPLRNRILALAASLGEEYAPEEADIQYQWGFTPKGQLALVPKDLIPHGSYTIELAEADA